MKGFGGSNEQNGNATEPRDDVKDSTKEERKEAEPSDSKIICGNEVIDSRKAGSGFVFVLFSLHNEASSGGKNVVAEEEAANIVCWTTI
ncbi:hypothetical protein F2Q69_00034497 [Brassica cretica]|uniref:Uncharacterized protein n=1 Tax=Brassica cretica TaxID=69181 RepID=A0A8S9SSP0_BRACR|nr:hypothetical protein F2Q69_00034497 [Brassica cretica]